ncbi:hypothetical protein LAD11_23535 [Escherichia coli]|uniref:hypothetical protein n=1 Tax=Escherichia coli TaxID=562 RepID=UPI0022712B89|nr:hypothetical protein [Escherichia coli]MCY0060658.1 hypothetical protein [Escherichia coli]
MWNGDENADDIAGRFTGTVIPELMRDLASMGQLVKFTDKKGKGLPRSGKGRRPWKYPTAPKKEPVSCCKLTALQLGWGFRKAFSFEPVIKTPFDLPKILTSVFKKHNQSLDKYAFLRKFSFSHLGEKEKWLTNNVILSAFYDLRYMVK